MPSVTHDAALKRTCRRCGLKSPTARFFTLSGRILDLYSKHFDDTVLEDALHSAFYPKGICSACNSILERAECDGKPIPSWNSQYDWGDPNAHHQCVERSCRVCCIWKSKSQPTEHPIGKPSASIASTSSNPLDLSNNDVLCPKCFLLRKSAGRHVCNAGKVEAAGNLATFAESRQLNEILLHRLARSAIGESSGSATIEKGGGKPVKISLGDDCAAKQSLDMSSFKKMKRAGVGMSTRQLQSVHRSVSESSSVSFRSILHDRESFNVYFESREMTFTAGPKRNETPYKGTLALCAHPLQLLNRLFPEIDPTTARLKLGIDHGKGFLKFTLQRVDIPEVANSVSFLLLLAVTSAVENYHNLKAVLDTAPLRDLIFICKNLQIVGDFKILCLLLGIMPGRHPCPWCAWDSRSAIGAPDAAARSELRREEMLERLATRFNNKHEHVKDCEGYERASLLLEFCLRADLLMLFPPPALHIMLGIFDKIYEALILLFADAAREEHNAALLRLGVRKSDYFGGKFEGNATRKILSRLDDAMLYPAPELLNDAERDTEKAMRYYDLLLSFNQVVHDCFGLERAAHYADSIDDFAAKYQLSGLSQTLKVHAILSHMKKYLEKYEKAGVGMARPSEQAGEHCHSVFDRYWQRRACSENAPSYPQRLVGALADYNYDVVDVNTTTPTAD